MILTKSRIHLLVRRPIGCERNQVLEIEFRSNRASRLWGGYDVDRLLNLTSKLGKAMSMTFLRKNSWGIVSCLATLLICGAAATGSASGEEGTKEAALAANPFAAHNAYPWRLYGKDRFERALKAGLKHIEVDVTYDPQRKAVVATHDTRPNGSETELGELLQPLWSTWGANAGDGFTLIIDLKSSSAELVRGLQAVLEPHAKLLSTLPKAGGPFVPGKITVCLTGSGDAHREYAAIIPSDGNYLAFGDVGYGETSWREDVSGYVPSEAPGFVRFLTFEFHNFMDAPRASGAERFSLDRLRETVRLANERGYRIRVYTINPARRNDQYDFRFWDRCVQAGMHMIATDAYEQAHEYWGKHVEAAAK